MGRKPDLTGLEVRSGSIRIVFYWRNRRCRETLKLEPTKANLTYAARLRAEILRKIEIGTFEYAEYFPDSDLARTTGTAPPRLSERSPRPGLRRQTFRNPRARATKRA